MIGAAHLALDVARAAAAVARRDPTTGNIATARSAIALAARVAQVVRLDQVAASAGGHGYNPYRDKGGKFAPGAHKERPKAGERHAAAVANAQKRVAAAAERVATQGSKLSAAHEGKRAAIADARDALGKARSAAELARAKPSAKNINAARVAANKATRTAAKVGKHDAAIAKHTELHAKATTAHAKAVESHARTIAGKGMARDLGEGSTVAPEHTKAERANENELATSRAGARESDVLGPATEPPPVIWEHKKNPKRVEAARTAAAASVERRREIHSAVASNLPHELQSTWAKEGHKFMRQEAPRIRGVKDRINAASKISEAFAEQYGAASETGRGYEGDRYHRRAEIEAKHAESWADAQERKYYAAAAAMHAEQHHQPAYDDDVPF